METYLHGIEFKETASASPPPVRGASPSVVGLVGTARRGPVDTPTLIRTRAEGVALFGAAGGTIPEAFDALFGHHATASLVVAVNVLDPAGNAAHRTDVAAAEHAFDGGVIQLPHTDIVAVEVTNQAADTTYALGEDYSVDADAGLISRISAGDIAAEATVKVAYGYPKEAGVTDVEIVGEAAADGSKSGIQALHAADGVARVKPKLLIAPGRSHTAAVAQALEAAANRLLGLNISEGPGTTNAAAMSFFIGLSPATALSGRTIALFYRM